MASLVGVPASRDPVRRVPGGSPIPPGAAGDLDRKVLDAEREGDTVRCSIVDAR
jgi:hypothetical protein